MKQQTKFYLAGIIILLGLTFPISRIIHTNGEVSIICDVVDAQDNPCLPQMATNTFLQLQLAQAIQTQAALEQRVIELEAGNTGTDATQSTEVGGLPFYEDFSDNSAGWRLPNGVSLVQGQLVLQPNREASPQIPVAPLSNFYVSVEMNNGRTNESGFLIGDNTSKNYHAIVYADSGNDIEVYHYINGNYEGRLFDVDVGEYNAPFTFAVDYQGGQFDVYINDEYMMTGQVNLYGGEIFLVSYDDYDGQIFDNLEVRASR